MISLDITIKNKLADFFANQNNNYDWQFLEERSEISFGRLPRRFYSHGVFLISLYRRDPLVLDRIPWVLYG